MREFVRPSWLSLVVLLVVGAAVAMVAWPGTVVTRATPLPVPAGDQEIAWLYPATTTTGWQRLVAAAATAAEQLRESYPGFGLEVDDRAAFPAQTTAVPEVVLSVRGCRSKLRLRWYKLTSDLKPPDWIDALTKRSPTPLVVAGGGSSDLGIDLAQDLRRVAGASVPLGRNAPLLLLTMATADEVKTPAGTVLLNDVYPGRTFRFCFTNRQMARAVTHFVWHQDDLRPDGDPAYVAIWEDDPFSVDLADRFYEALRLPASSATVRAWAWLGFFSAMGGLPISGDSVAAGQFRMSLTPLPERIPYSLGGFSHPNRWELDAGRDFLDHLAQRPGQKRPLLVLPASAQPARRFLRGLERNDPSLARRFVVATGDAISFNVIYRDRNLTWPIQDLPYAVVFFCHRDPVDARAGFKPETHRSGAANPNDGSATTGTEDLLLDVDLIEALSRAAFEDSRLVPDAATLALRVSAIRLDAGGRVAFDGFARSLGRPLFDGSGNRRDGTGEHVVCLRPAFEGERILPRATIEVWSWRLDDTATGQWKRTCPTLAVEYDETPGP